MNHKLSRDKLDSSSKKKFSELKRLEAWELKQSESRQRQDAVRQALTLVDGKKKTANKKIIFSDDLAPTQAELFPEDDDVEGWNDSFNVAPQFEGSRGHKLLKLQNRFGHDERFRIDSRFAESSDDEETESGRKISLEKAGSEYKTNMLALQQVVDVTVVRNHSEKQNIFRDVSSLRYDPTKQDSKRFKKVEEKKGQKTIHASGIVKQEPEPPPQVSDERFYEVSESFRETLVKESGKGFSLLSSFCRQPIPTNEEEKEIEESTGTTSRAKTKGPKPMARNESVSQKKYVPHPKSEVGSRFFIFPGDYRLKEGVRFFCRQQTTEEIREQWQKGRENAKKIFQLKHRRADRQHWNKPRRKR